MRTRVYLLVDASKALAFINAREDIDNIQYLENVIMDHDEDAVVINETLESLECGKPLRLLMLDVVQPANDREAISLPGHRIATMRELFDCTLADMEVEISE